MTPYQRLVQQWINCQRCPLHVMRKRVVMCRGVLPADVLFIGEAPGESEDVLGKPFVGPAGKLLDQIIGDAEADSGVAPTKAWTNLVACIPKDEGSARKRGEPLPEEIEECSPRLDRLLQICKPKLVVAVGALSDKRSKTQRWDTLAKVVSIVHPAAILRADVSQRGLSIQRCIVQLSDAFADLGD